MQVCMRGLPHCHLQQRGQTLVSMPALHRTQACIGACPNGVCSTDGGLDGRLLACICSHQAARRGRRNQGGDALLLCTPSEGHKL